MLDYKITEHTPVFVLEKQANCKVVHPRKLTARRSYKNYHKAVGVKIFTKCYFETKFSLEL